MNTSISKMTNRRNDQSLQKSLVNFKAKSKSRLNAKRLKELFQKNSENGFQEKTKVLNSKCNDNVEEGRLPNVLLKKAEKEKKNLLGRKQIIQNATESKLNCKSKRKYASNTALAQLKAGRFRYLNEQMYTSVGKDSFNYFKKDPEAYEEYHNGFQQQIKKWPINPVDDIIKDLRTCKQKFIIADFGCGDAKIAQTFPERTVHSFDLKALNEYVTECDISKVPLEKESVDIAVLCLSLMGINFQDYLIEASRVLKVGGTLYIAEVISRFENQDMFVKCLKASGFKILTQNWSNKMFALIKLQKIKKKINVNKLTSLKLGPCLYKKR